jgi:positive regulator of sigma E activity
MPYASMGISVAKVALTIIVLLIAMLGLTILATYVFTYEPQVLMVIFTVVATAFLGFVLLTFFRKQEK